MPKTKKSRLPKAPPKPEYPKVIEVIGKPYLGSLEYGSKDQPSCFNGTVSVHKYRITVEKVEEPQEVIHARLTKLWRESNNHHHYSPLVTAALAEGLKLDPLERGVDRKKD